MLQLCIYFQSMANLKLTTFFFPLQALIEELYNNYFRLRLLLSQLVCESCMSHTSSYISGSLTSCQKTITNATKQFDTHTTGTAERKLSNSTVHNAVWDIHLHDIFLSKVKFSRDMSFYKSIKIPCKLLPPFSNTISVFLEACSIFFIWLPDALIIFDIFKYKNQASTFILQFRSNLITLFSSRNLFVCPLNGNCGLFYTLSGFHMIISLQLAYMLIFHCHCLLNKCLWLL